MADQNPVFSLTRNGGIILKQEEPIAPKASGSLIAVGETQDFGFQLTPREPDTDYAIRIGEYEVDSDESGLLPGTAFGERVLWQDNRHFESARGEVKTRLFSRRQGVTDADPWTFRQELHVLVHPSKIGEQRYQAMFDSLFGLANWIVYDLVGRSEGSLQLEKPAKGPRARSSQIELQVIESLLARLQPVLSHIAREPARAICRQTSVRNCWGTEKLGSNSFRNLAQIGRDPRREPSAWPMTILCEDLGETEATIEHRVILGFLRLLLSRVTDCDGNARLQIEALEAERRYFDKPRRRGKPSLFDQVNRPQISRLKNARVRAQRAKNSLRVVWRFRIFRGLKPEPRLVSSPVFQNVIAYRRIWNLMRSYLSSSAAVLDIGGGMRVKDTWRMYEQWVFFQIAAALREAGLAFESAHGVLTRHTRFRFTLDLDRDARISFLAPDGQAVVVRYEPCVLGKAEASARHVSAFRRRGGDPPWRPDILIEVLEGHVREGIAPIVSAAVVIDAKYTESVRDHHWDRVRKYAEIRSTQSELQIVKHVWIAYPGANEAISLADRTLDWTKYGPTCPRSELVYGTAAILPPTTWAASGDNEFGRPTATALALVQGVLRHLGVAVAVEGGNMALGD